MKEEEMEEQGGEEAAAAATTASSPLSLHPETSGMSDEGHNLEGQGWGYNFSHHSCR